VNPSLPIGVFDSGVGGLTVVKEIFRQMPAERVVYFGDTARAPYGNKAKETLVRFAQENARFLSHQNVKLLVVACNSSSAYCLPPLRKSLGIPVVGVIEPGAWAAFSKTRNHRVGVIGTSATISSGAYQKQLEDLHPTIRVFARPCPLFVPLVEEGWQGHAVTEAVAREYLKPFKSEKIDTLVLGCTHYPLLKPVLSKLLGPRVTLVDSAEETARQVRQLLANKRLLAPGGAKPVSAHRFYVSDVPDKFVAVGKRFLGKMPKVVQAEV
jgi:glutamate racemase